MTTLSDARRAYREALSKYQERTPSRVAVLGDGRGTATSNVLVPGRPDYVYARDDVTSTRFFQVLNQGAVQPAANLPVYVGYPFPTGTGSDEEQVIRINYSGLGDIDSGTVPPTGPHHQQHEFRGGDDILLDSRQFLPGLVHPTDPISMQVQVESFIYFWDTWRRWEIARSKDLTEYIPSSGYVLWVMIVLDPETGQLVYRPGVPFATGSQDVILGTFTPVPAPAGNELPLGYVRLASSTTVIDWTSSGDNIGDARLWVNPPMLHILDRIEQLEGLSGNPPDLMMMGVASASVSEFGNNTLDGLNDVNVAGATNNQTIAYQASTATWISTTLAGTGTVTGTGTSGRVARWDGASSITDSLIRDDGTTINVGGAPTSTRYFQVAQPDVTSGAPSALYVTGGAHTTLTASAEASDVVFLLNRIVQHNTGAITSQRAVVITPPTYSFVGASTITTAATVAISGAPVAGTFATITTPLALWVQAGNVLLGALPLDNTISVAQEITTGVTATSLYALGLLVSSTLTAHANADILRPVFIFPTYAKSSFTGLHASGLIVTVNTVSGSGTIDDYAAIQILEGSVATSDIGLLIGTHPAGSTDYAMYINTTNSSVITGAGLQMGAPTGGDKGSGTINVATDIYKNNGVYNNPDFALELWATGGIDRFSRNVGASDYRRMSLGEIEKYIRNHYQLPRVGESRGIFERADIVLEKIEEIFTHLIEFNERIGKLENVKHS